MSNRATENRKRKTILDRVRSTQLPQCDLPSLHQEWTQFADPLQTFSELLTSVGGRCVEVSDSTELQQWLRQQQFYQSARRICSLVDPSLGNVELHGIDPHSLADLDLVIAPGELAVAENGAVWVSDRQIAHRAALFIAQHAALVVPRENLVHNLHEAYERLRFDERGFGVFISGPSKTADIEQSLVIGAHGPKSLHVVVVRGASATC